MIKAVQIVGREGTYLNEIKAIYNKPPAKSISSKIRNETRKPALATFIQNSCGSCSHSNQRRKKNKGDVDWKGRRKSVTACRNQVTSVVYNSLQPHGLSLSRLLSPWDSPGKNNGVGCHSLLWGIVLTQGSNPHLLCPLHCGQTLQTCR